MNAFSISKSDAESLASHGEPAYVNTTDLASDKYFTYPDIAANHVLSGSTYTLSATENSNMYILDYDVATGGYPPRKKNMFPR